MPVEEGKTCSGRQPKISAAAAQVARAASSPAWPGGAVGVAGIDGDYANLAAGGAQVLLVHNKGAAVTRLAVKTAAALAGASATMRAKSVRPLFLSPAFAAPKRKPRGRENIEAFDIYLSLNLAGAKG